MKLNLLAETAPSIALMNVLCHKDNGKSSQMCEKFIEKLPDGSWDRDVEVELFVNGKPVSWENAMLEMMEIRKEEVDRLVGNRLANILSCDGIKQTVDQIDSIKWELRNRIEQIAGEKIEWPEDY